MFDRLSDISFVWRILQSRGCDNAATVGILPEEAPQVQDFEMNNILELPVLSQSGPEVDYGLNYMPHLLEHGFNAQQSPDSLF